MTDFVEVSQGHIQRARDVKCHHGFMEDEGGEIGSHGQAPRLSLVTPRSS